MAKQCIGIDIGHHAIKLVQLKIGRRGEHSLQNFGIEPLPEGAIVDGTVMDHTAVAGALRELKDRIRLKGAEAALAISGRGVIIKRLQIPYIEDGLEEAMNWEVQQNIPFSRDEVLVDYTVLVEQTPDGQMEVLLVAAKRDIVEQYVHVIRDAGFKDTVVEPVAFSIQNAVEQAVGFAPGEVVGIINVGAVHSSLSVVVEGAPVFTREVNKGGNTYTTAIMNKLGVSFDAGEAYKVGGASPGSAEVVPHEVPALIQEISHEVALEFQRSIDFFINESVEGRLSRIFLTGGTALVSQLAQAVQERARIPVHILDPFGRTTIDEKRWDMNYLRENAPVAAAAFGLALRRQGDS